MNSFLKVIKAPYFLAISLSAMLFLFIGISLAQVKGDSASSSVDASSHVELASLSRVESNVRSAAVKVVVPGGGHGSGTYVRINGLDIILTARHVADREGAYIIKAGDEEVAGVVVYRNDEHDIAAILIDGMQTRRPMRFRPLSGEADVGEETVYSGYPSDHSLLTFRGMVVGYASHGNLGSSIIVHTFGWFGCSGSGVYDNRGRLVGILWGVDAQGTPFGGQIVEDVLWIAPASQIDVDEIMRNSCTLKLGSEDCARYLENSRE